MNSIVVYVSIGNSDDKLTRREWSDFWSRINWILSQYSVKTYGVWHSFPAAPFENACWCVEISLDQVSRVKTALGEIGKRFRQDSVAWAIIPSTEFLTQ